MYIVTKGDSVGTKTEFMTDDFKEAMAVFDYLPEHEPEYSHWCLHKNGHLLIEKVIRGNEKYELVHAGS